MGCRRRKAWRDKDIGKRDSFHPPVKRNGPWHTRRRGRTPGVAGAAPGSAPAYPHGAATSVAVPRESSPGARTLEPGLLTHLPTGQVTPGRAFPPRVRILPVGRRVTAAPGQPLLPVFPWFRAEHSFISSSGATSDADANTTDGSVAGGLSITLTLTGQPRRHPRRRCLHTVVRLRPTRPAPVSRPRLQPRPQRVALDGAPATEQILVRLHRRALDRPAAGAIGRRRGRNVPFSGAFAPPEATDTAGSCRQGPPP